MKFWIFILIISYTIQIIAILGLIQEMTKPKISFKSNVSKGYYLDGDGTWRNEQGQKIEQLSLPDGSIPKRDLSINTPLNQEHFSFVNISEFFYKEE